MESLRKRCRKKQIYPSQLAKRVKELKGKIVTLNGSFDLLHAGHLEIIYRAKQLGDILIVALNTDKSIKRYKDKKRPIIPLEYRALLLSSIEFVDFVTWFDEDNPIKILDIIKPSIHVNGSEYGKNCIEALVVKKNGGKIHIVKKLKGLSTSSIIKKIGSL